MTYRDTAYLKNLFWQFTKNIHKKREQGRKMSFIIDLLKRISEILWNRICNALKII